MEGDRKILSIARASSDTMRWCAVSGAALYWAVVLWAAREVAAVAGDESCEYEGLGNYASCYDANATASPNSTWYGNVTLDPCSSCHVHVAWPSLTYGAYVGPYVETTGCEPAVPWICPPSDNGQCCAAKATLSATESARRLCASRVSDDASLESVHFTREQVTSLLAGVEVPVPVALDYASVISIRGKWADQPQYRVALRVASTATTDGTVHTITLNRISGIASVMDDVGTRLVRAEFPVSNATELFYMAFTLHWRRLRMYGRAYLGITYGQLRCTDAVY